MDAPIQSHNQKSAAVWNSGGSGYDTISRGIADSIEHCVLRLGPKQGERILDLATGTGWTSRAVARSGAKVVGVDIASDLLAEATARAAAERLDIEYRVGDAEKLPFADGEFDAVISTCGVMFATHQEAAAAELGGRIALTTWLSDSNLFKMFEVMRPYMAPPPSPAPPSLFEWGRTDRIKELLGRDFDLKFEKGVSYYREPSGEAAWNTFSTSYGPTKSLARLAVVAGAGHMGPMTHTAEVNALIVQHLTGIEARSRQSQLQGTPDIGSDGQFLAAGAAP